jgi:hypothetical protein
VIDRYARFVQRVGRTESVLRTDRGTPV